MRADMKSWMWRGFLFLVVGMFVFTGIHELLDSVGGTPLSHKTPQDFLKFLAFTAGTILAFLLFLKIEKRMHLIQPTWPRILMVITAAVLFWVLWIWLETRFPNHPILTEFFNTSGYMVIGPLCIAGSFLLRGIRNTKARHAAPKIPLKDGEDCY
ncbi:MAG: hypothetical protein ABI615_13700 [Chthoniobacterales bacterium]